VVLTELRGQVHECGDGRAPHYVYGGGTGCPVMDADEAVFHTIDEYSRMAEAYDRHIRPRFEPIAQRLVELLDPKEGEKVLDIGAGTGNATLPIASRVGPSGLVAAIDASDGQLRVLQSRASDAGLSHIHAETMNADHILYPRGAFHAVVSNLGVPALRWRQTLGEAFRVLRDGGRLVLAQWDGIAEWQRVYAEAQKPHQTPTPSPRLTQLREASAALNDCPDRDELFDPEHVKVALTKMGFTRLQTVRETFRPGFASLDAFLEFRTAWGYSEMEWREMAQAERAAFQREVEQGFRRVFGGVEALDFKIFFTTAWRE